MPKLFYKTHTIPYSDIEAVETRRELYGGIIAPVMLRGARIVTKGGQKIPLGYVSEANTDPALPVPEIAAEIARRAGLEVIDRDGSPAGSQEDLRHPGKRRRHSSRY